MITPLLILFFLGMLQAVIGWIMVVSGLTGDAIYVKPQNWPCILYLRSV